MANIHGLFVNKNFWLVPLKIPAKKRQNKLDDDIGSVCATDIQVNGYYVENVLSTYFFCEEKIKPPRIL